MNFPYKYFNPVQTQFLQEVPKDNNVVACARTSAGKTTIAEMIASHTISELRKTDPQATVAYIGPLKALCKEKEQDWTDPNHPFGNYNVSVLTGDYILTNARRKELAEADIICMSSEMLGSRIRRNKAEKNNWLNDIRTLVVDESHLLTVEGRGPNLETAIVKFARVNPKCRIIFLSATMPNVDELGSWLTKLNGKPTSILKSDYRPVKLNIHYTPYLDHRQYHKNEASKIDAAMDLLDRFPNDKFIVFVHSKKTGRKVLKMLQDKHIKSEFHCADLDKETRERLELGFRSRDPESIRVLVATSGLAWGINMPARRGIVLGINRGLALVLPLDIVQMCGRCGRLGLDKEGDAYILVRQTLASREKAYCEDVGDIRSQINNIDTLGFHLVSEISERTIKNKADAIKWFKRTLAYHQNIMGDEKDAEALVSDTIDALEKFSAVKSDTELRTTPIGDISSWFYFSPFDVAYWKRNFCRVFQNEDPSNEELVWAIANTSTNAKDFNTDLDATGVMMVNAIENALKVRMEDGIPKHAYAIYSLLVNHEPEIPEIRGLMGNYRMDIERIVSAIELLDSRTSYFKDLPGAYKMLELPYRLKYGIPKDGLELVLLPRIGTQTAKKLMQSRRIYTAKDFLAAVRMQQAPVKENLIPKILPVAEEIARVGVMDYLKNLRKKKARRS